MNKLLAFLIAMALATMLSANNISISNVSLTGQNTTLNYTQVQFDLSWENSWRTSSAPNNWDAAWVFVKYRTRAVNYASFPGATSSDPVIYTSNAGATNLIYAYSDVAIYASGTTITVNNSTAGLSVGMLVRGFKIVSLPPDQEEFPQLFPPGTLITQVIDDYRFEVSQAPLYPIDMYGGEGAVQFYSPSTTIKVSNTDGLTVGMHLSVTAGYGAFAEGTTVTEISDGTHFLVSTLPVIPLSDGAVVTGIAPTIITVDFIVNLTVGMPVSVTGGTGEFAPGTYVTKIIDDFNFEISAPPIIPLSGGAIVSGFLLGNWDHAKINTSAFNAPPGTTIAPASDNTGAFIYRFADGTGTFSKTGIQLRWNYGENGVADNAKIDIQVYAIEMVYVPGGSFFIGSGGNESAAFYKYPTTTNAYHVNSEAAITVGTSDDNLYYAPSQYCGDGLGPIPDAYPKGYNAFYCMKYEVSQQQYVDFLNSLTVLQAGNRYSVESSGYRYGITVTNNIYSTTFPYVACNYLSWADLAAYLDWSGLRPMTELEFEKACRGTVSPVANEFAWGTADIVYSSYTLSNTGENNEDIASNYSVTVGNAAFSETTGVSGSIGGPVRVGIFAGTSGSTGRITAGSTYYGIMEMSGNTWDRAITVGNPTGRNFTAIQGDGVTDAEGNADVSTWPNTDGEGVGLHGGLWDGAVNDLRVSDRNSATDSGARASIYGGRGVRSVP